MYTTPAYLPWLLATLVVGLLLWLAWRRPARKRLAWRLLASLVAGICLVLIVFPPTIQHAINPGAATLLTKGYHTDTLNALLNRQPAKPVIYSLEAEAEHAISLADLHTLRQQQPNLKTLHLLGYGLDEAQLKTLEGIKLVPHLSASPAGISAVQWPESVNLGETVTIAGKYKTASETKLYLQAAGQLRDSVELQPDSTFTFNLRYAPKQTGRWVYTLLAKTDGQQDTLGHVPVQVKEQQQLQILLLAATPSFEFKFLKNHLAAQQHKVAYRATVSRNISQTEFVNTPKTDLSQLTPKLLQNIDVVITDEQVLQNLSARERATLQRAVTQDGLGVLTIVTEPASGKTTGFFTGFRSKRLSQHSSRSTRASWPGNQATINASAYALAPTEAVTGLVAAQGNNLLVAAKKAGWGKVAMSYVPQTFQWQLEGNKNVYASYWATILAAIVKEEVRDKFWQLEKPQVPQPRKPAILSFTDYTLTTGATPPTATITSLTDSTTINLPLAQNVHQPEKYSGTFWPGKSGWHKVETPDAAPYFFYVQQPSDWEFETIANRKMATEEFIARQTIKATESAIAYKDEPVSLIWFFVLFTLSSGFLWLEEKL
ncbi:hypothetical protein [Pontibacter fetidus]|uniref:Uncharacterized protein n=1 Tax=Pontibacter fetidus TaxID=2700082 RepID=A0A6B2H6V2_9BACT|nr:hypothetical protein [Pontibacter fetidus]NDK54972.1 hypothetical protein [Pontibacter fetidus]